MRSKNRIFKKLIMRVLIKTNKIFIEDFLICHVDGGLPLSITSLMNN